MATPLALTRFPGPVYSGGARLLPGYQASPNARGYTLGGKAYFVGNLAGGGYGDGTTPDAPISALFGSGGALARLGGRLNKGDTIYILPGHVESVSAADMASDTGAASGFSVQGLGSGPQRGTFNWTAATSTWLLDTAGVELANLNLNLCGNTATGTLTVATPITVSAAGCRIVDCDINWGQDNDTGCGSTLGAIALVSAANFDFIGNRCVSIEATPGSLAVSFLSVNGCNELRVMNNFIHGGTTSTTVGALHFLTAASLRVAIYNNYIANLKASSTIAVSSAISGVTGAAGYNNLRVNSGILGFTQSANLSLTFYQNYTSDAVNLNGALDIVGGTAT